MRRALPLVLLLLATVATAADWSVRAEVTAARVGVEDQFQLAVTLENASAEIGVPSLTNLRVVGGPFTSSQISIVNGAMTQSRVQTFVLQAQAPGKAEVGAVKVQVGGVEKSTAPIAIEVMPGRLLQQRQRRPDPFDPFGGEDPFESVFGRQRRGPPPKLTLIAEASRRKLHVGEPLVVTYWLYTQVAVTDLQFADAPQFPGFWSEDLEKPKVAAQGEPATLGGERFQRAPLFQKLLFPTRAGKLTIPAARFKVGVQRSAFDVGAAVERSTEPIDVEVEPLPEEAGFAGAVGRYRVSASVDRSALGIGDAATVSFQVQGSGNLKWVDRAPALQIAGAKVFPPQQKSDLKPTPNGVAGSRTWEFVVVPQTSGAIEVPALGFAWFDPAAGKVLRASTAPLTLEVAGAAAGAGPAAAPAPAARPAGSLALRSDLDLPSPLLPWLGPRALLGTLAIALLAHLALAAGPALSFGRPGGTRRGGSRAALAELAHAARGDLGKEEAAALVEKALHEAFGDLDVPDPGERERAALAVLEQVRFLRYAPQLGDYSEQVREVAGRAAEVVRRWA